MPKAVKVKRLQKSLFIFTLVVLLTGNSGAPLTHTLSAKRTRLGRDRSLARLPAESSVDLRPGMTQCAIGWQTSNETCVSQARTSCMTWSRGASLTSSPLTASIWSPGCNLPMLGPPSVTKRTITGRSLPATKPKPKLGLRCSKTRRGSGGCSSHLMHSGAS